MKVSAIIAAGGSGSRLGKAEGKQLLELQGQPVIAYSIKTILPLVDEIILVIRPEDVDKAGTVFDCDEGDDKESCNKKIVAGGMTRTESVRNALSALSSDTDIVIIHDGARPFISSDIVEKSIAAAKEFGAAVVSVPVTDTIKQADNKGFVKSTPDRSSLWAAQTPQAFRYDIIKKVYDSDNSAELVHAELNADHNKDNSFTKKLAGYTDDASMAEALGYQVKIVEGDYNNFKITTEEDLQLAEYLLNAG
ncbi:2-C-methyl-D-erythritol 4-phosphate cytidylyltransferase [Candidatus Margulisiibacteriota bacterium]